MSIFAELGKRVSVWLQRPADRNASPQSGEDVGGAAEAPDRAEPETAVQDGQIDVRELIARYDHVRHAALADAYFAPLLDNQLLRRKPFAHLGEAVQIMAAFSQLLDGLALFRQARVLDFGIGTGWSSRILASLGMQVTAIDVSENALRMARSIQEQDPLLRGLPIDYRVFDGRALPFEAGAFDRILCFDAFHHVPDQAAVLHEFARVLAVDGIAGFAEPGPRHSLTPSSQMEMKAHGVIENDIKVEEIWNIARGCGFADVKLSFAMPRQELVSLTDFDHILRRRSAPDSVVFSPTNVALHENRRLFFLHRTNVVLLDSRSGEGLHCRLDLVGLSQGPTTASVVLSVVNTGPSRWRPSGGGAGSVNVGAHLRTLTGEVSNFDYARFALAERFVESGETVEVAGELPLPDLEDFEIELDLVAEEVAWFELRGNRTLKLTFRGRQWCPPSTGGSRSENGA